jgi:hypothetical protein
MRLAIADCRLPIADCRLPIGDWRLSIGDWRLAFSQGFNQKSTIGNCQCNRSLPLPYRCEMPIGNWQSPIANLQGFVLGLVQSRKAERRSKKTVLKTKTLC